jgi:hypothetical protein
MVCPNCHSHNIIAVQDQLFCINCGQMVPPPEGQSAKAALATPDAPTISAIAAAGSSRTLEASPDNSESTPKGKRGRKKAAPEASPSPEPEAPPVAEGSDPEQKDSTEAKPTDEAKPVAETPSDEQTHDDQKPEPDKDSTSEPIESKPASDQTPEPAPEADAKPTSEPATENSSTKHRKQKPGRPRKRLDTPVAVAATAPLPAAPGIRRMSDITPKPPESEAAATPKPEKDQLESQDKSSGRHSKDKHTGHKDAKPAHSLFAKLQSPLIHAHTDKTSAGQGHTGHAKPTIHKVGLPPLHYAHVLRFSLRERVRPHWLVLSALALAALLSAFIYGGWLLVTIPPSDLATQVLTAGPQMLVELVVLAALYYVGRSISQTAIIYGIAREADARPVSLSRQLGTGVNTFGRRLVLDLTFGIIDLTLLGLMLILFITGGSAWPVSPEIQVVAIFVAYLILLYLLTGLAMARGLAGVALTLTPKDTWPAISFGWQLFSHRFELVGLRFLALAMELLLALPLAALALAMILAAPAALHPAVALGIGLLAWLAGALLGAGTAAWWAALYRRLILADHHHHNDSTEAVALLSSRQPQDARRAPLTLIVAVSSFLLAAALAIPWFRLPK